MQTWIDRFEPAKAVTPGVDPAPRVGRNDRSQREATTPSQQERPIQAWRGHREPIGTVDPLLD
jgi:hypothetical protein